MTGVPVNNFSSEADLRCPEPNERPDLWPANTERRSDGVLGIGGISVTELARAYATPVYVMDHADLRDRARVWASAMAEEFWSGYGMSGGDAFYAGKAFMCSGVVRTVIESGMGIDTASLGELTLALRSGADPARIGLHGNNKSDQEIELALQAGDGKGIARIFIDSEDEVDQIAAVAQRLGCRARVMLRLKTGIHAGGNEFIATSHEDQKFGVSIADGSALGITKKILVNPYLELLGFHNHIGSQIVGTDAFVAALRILLSFREEVYRETGVDTHELDLGGGLGISYEPSDPLPTSPAELSRILSQVIRETCAEHASSIPHVSVEPGRSVAGPSVVTLYTVGAIKDVTVENGHVRRYVSVDGGMSDNIRPALYGAIYTATLANRKPSAPWRRCRVVGCHCESGDIVIREVDLPEDLHRGDILAVPATGAYGWSMASNYNMLTKPGVLSVENGAATWVVRPQTVEDLLALDMGLA